MDFTYIFELFLRMAPGVKYTVGIFLITLTLSLPAGFILAFARAGKNKILKALVGFYVWIMRGTPLLLQIFFVYFGLTFIPGIGPYLTFDRFSAAIIAFSCNYAAYFCEIFRGGLLSIEKGQYEAAKVLGFSNTQTTFKIVIPQMLKVCLPPITNESITLVKDTALITFIGVTEILYYTKAIVNTDVNPTAYLVAACYYLFATFLLTKLFTYFERKYSF